MGARLCEATTNKGSFSDSLKPYPVGGPSSAAAGLPQSQAWPTRSPQAAEPLGLQRLPLPPWCSPSELPSCN